MLTLIEDAGTGALLLVEGLEPGEFSRSRLTRGEVCRQLRLMADTLQTLPEETRAAMAEIDWDGWRLLAPSLAAAAGSPSGVAPEDDPAWFAANTLVPATLSWLRVYRHNQPGLFDFKP